MRPENPKLDDSQMADLQNFLAQQPKETLENFLQQLIQDSEADRGPYPAGGTPANVSKAYLAIKEALEKRP